MTSYNHTRGASADSPTTSIYHPYCIYTSGNESEVVSSMIEHTCMQHPERAIWIIWSDQTVQRTCNGRSITAYADQIAYRDPCGAAIRITTMQPIMCLPSSIHSVDLYLVRTTTTADSTASSSPSSLSRRKRINIRRVMVSDICSKRIAQLLRSTWFYEMDCARTVYFLCSGQYHRMDDTICHLTLDHQMVALSREASEGIDLEPGDVVCFCPMHKLHHLARHHPCRSTAHPRQTNHNLLDSRTKNDQHGDPITNTQEHDGPVAAAITNDLISNDEHATPIPCQSTSNESTATANATLTAMDSQSRDMNHDSQSLVPSRRQDQHHSDPSSTLTAPQKNNSAAHESNNNNGDPLITMHVAVCLNSEPCTLYLGKMGHRGPLIVQDWHGVQQLLNTNAMSMALLSGMCMEDKAHCA